MSLRRRAIAHRVAVEAVKGPGRPDHGAGGRSVADADAQRDAELVAEPEAAGQRAQAVGEEQHVVEVRRRVWAGLRRLVEGPRGAGARDNVPVALPPPPSPPPPPPPPPPWVTAGWGLRDGLQGGGVVRQELDARTRKRRARGPVARIRRQRL